MHEIDRILSYLPRQFRLWLRLRLWVGLGDFDACKGENPVGGMMTHDDPSFKPRACKIISAPHVDRFFYPVFQS